MVEFFKKGEKNTAFKEDKGEAQKIRVYHLE